MTPLPIPSIGPHILLILLKFMRSLKEEIVHFNRNIDHEL